MNAPFAVGHICNGKLDGASIEIMKMKLSSY